MTGPQELSTVSLTKDEEERIELATNSLEGELKEILSRTMEKSIKRNKLRQQEKDKLEAAGANR